ncbi:MAG: phosphoenolpyruvate synthase [Candidatus Diapherotrites archaeon]|nr:phosphoenolpyruvate synthase [Candidatus Diapherotrites archaeon]
MKNILWFREIHAGDVPLVGGKGANLGEMTNANFPIPPGFVITAQAYFNFLKETEIEDDVIVKENSIDVENIGQLQKSAEELRNLIASARMSGELEIEIKKAYRALGERQVAWLTSSEEACVAVRSSATAEDLPTASFAGQQETYLNIRGGEALVDAVKRCWASLFTARAIYYRRKNNFAIEKVGIAVVVQKMVNSDVSGVMFTAEPMGDRSKIIIEAVFGLGETIVSGAVTPDHYVVDKGKLKIIERIANEQTWMITRASRGTKQEELPKKNQSKQKLTDKQVIEIAKIGKQIENHYNFPQDIEFAIENNALYVVQSRAITTLKTETKEEKSEEERIEKEIAQGNAVASGLGASPGIAIGRIKIIPSVSDVAKLEKGEILVTRMTSPDWVPTMRKAAAIVTDEGGLTCHAAIVSRELGIPCIVGTENATEKLQDGMLATVDGYSGKIYEGKIEVSMEVKRAEAKAETSLAEIEEEVEELKEEMHEIVAVEKTPKEIAGHRILVKVNVALPEAAERASATGADGVGLLRAEHMITASGTHPAEFLRNGKGAELKDIVKNGIRGVAVHFKNKPVWYRTFDARTDEFRNLKGGENEPHEDNPMLGWHGIRRDLDEPELLRAQFRAIKELREEGFWNIGIMLPFVQSAEEFRRAKEIAKGIGLKPGEKELQFGVMIETPASVWVIDELIEAGAEFISFGTNDLTQLTLGIDRNNERIQRWFSELHPAILMEAKHVIERCRKAGVETSICGQAGSNPEMVKRLVVFGIDSVSANIDAVEAIRKVIAEERRQLAEQG